MIDKDRQLSSVLFDEFCIVYLCKYVELKYSHVCVRVCACVCVCVCVCMCVCVCV